MAVVTPPGWYPDPWQPGAQRWWDGTGWTQQVAPVHLPPPPIDISPRIADALAMARWARVAVCVWPALITLSAAVSVATFRDLFDDFGEQLDQIEAGNQTTFESSGSGLSAASSAVSMVQLGLLIALGLWIMRSAELGRAVGRPADRSPAWGVGGFFVPIVNFWFPYQVLVQSLSPSAARGPVLAWWLAFLGSQFSFVVGIALAIAGVPIAGLLGLSAVLSVVTALLGLRAVDAVTADHEATKAARGGHAAAPPFV